LLKRNPALVFSKDENGATPLHWAVLNDHKEAVELMLANRADVNARKNNGDSPLHWAAVRNHSDMVELLLAHKADVDTRDDDGNTPLYNAAAKGYRDVAQVLLAHNADVNAKDDRAYTPLHIAAFNGHQDMVAFLLANGANVNAIANHGVTPLRCAKWKDHKDVEELLRQHGGYELPTSRAEWPYPYMATRFPTFMMLALSVTFVGSLVLLISSLRPGQGVRNREQRLTALTALLGFLHVGLRLYWYFYVGFIQLRGLATAYDFASYLLGGIWVGMLLYIVSPRSPKVVLVVSGLSFVAFNLFAFSYYGPRHVASAIRFSSVGNGLFVGMSIHAAIFLRLSEGKKNKRNQSGDGSTAMPGTTTGNGREA
jgi:hypothetical protein